MRRHLVFCVAGTILFLGISSPARAQPQAPRPSDPYRLETQRPGKTDVYILSFGLWGPQSVFESEAKGAARILESRLGSKGRTVVRFNSKRRTEATPASLMGAAQAAGRALDPAEDVVVLFLTSHGGPRGIALAAGRSMSIMTPADVGAILDAARARHRVVIVSACYSGTFARALADARTLVITAAAADKPSFGCRDGAVWTYFGDAFFNRGMQGESRLDAAFEKARAFVTQRETREGFDPSDPQIAGGSLVLERLGLR